MLASIGFGPISDETEPCRRRNLGCEKKSRQSLLQRPTERSFRRHLVFQSQRQAACPLFRSFEVAAGRRALEMAGGESESISSSDTGQTDRRLRAEADHGRPFHAAHPDSRPEHPHRPGLVAARLAAVLCRAETGQSAGHRLFQPAADRPRFGQPQPLRPSRPRHAEAAEDKARPAGADAARQ